MDSPHNEPLIRKAFQYHNVIIELRYWDSTWNQFHRIIQNSHIFPKYLSPLLFLAVFDQSISQEYAVHTTSRVESTRFAVGCVLLLLLPISLRATLLAQWQWHRHGRLSATETIQGLYSLSGKTSYRKISWSFEAARFGLKLFQSLWNLAGTSAALLPRCLSNFKFLIVFFLSWYDHCNIQSRGFETSRDLAVRRLTAYWIEALKHMVNRSHDSMRNSKYEQCLELQWLTLDTLAKQMASWSDHQLGILPALPYKNSRLKQ